MDIGEPAAKDLLDRVITDIRFDIRPLIGKDSLDMTDEDRAELTEVLNAVTNDQVLITHGTDTMPETARYLEMCIRDRVFAMRASSPLLLRLFQDSSLMPCAVIRSPRHASSVSYTHLDVYKRQLSFCCWSPA